MGRVIDVSDLIQIQLPKMKWNLYTYFNIGLEEFKNTWEDNHQKSSIDNDESFFIVFVATRSVEECPDFSEFSSYYYYNPLSFYMVQGGYYLPNNSVEDIGTFLKGEFFGESDFEDVNIIVRGDV